MSAVAELLALKQRLEQQITSLSSELETISKTIAILERESPGLSPQLLIPEVVPTTKPQSVSNASSDASVGLTERCMQLVDTDWTAPTTVRDRLIATGYHITDKGRLLSSVYATLSRLAESGKLETSKIGGKGMYRRLGSQIAAA
jgi:hypothetical protein